MSITTSLSAVLVVLMSFAPGGQWGCDGVSGGVQGVAAVADSDPVLVFVTPRDGDVVESLTYGSVQVRASDPDAGTRDGAGIFAVDMAVSDAATGELVAARTEYWATYDFGPNLPDGVYRFTATAHADWFAGGTSATESITITVQSDATVPVTSTAVPVTPTVVPPPAVPPVATVTPTVVPPTSVPTVQPTAVPPAPTVQPTAVPPAVTPTAVPPTPVPTVPPTPVPATPVPTVQPTAVPPTPVPTVQPTAVPPTPVPATAVPATPVPVGPSGSAAEAASASLAALNQVRAQVGLAPLTLNSSMSDFALDWSQTMSQSGFRHSSGPYGENIAWYSDGSISPQAAAAFFNDSWVNSPGHYANMTSARYTEVGIGLYQDASGWWATHVFR